MHLKIKLVKLGILVFLEALSTIFIEKKKPPRFHCETFHVFFCIFHIWISENKIYTFMDLFSLVNE